jgi:hypothetical protein
MKTIRDVIVDLDRAFKADPRPSCFHCLGVVSLELCTEVERHIRGNLSKVYTVEDGICRKRDHQARVIRLRNGS